MAQYQFVYRSPKDNTLQHVNIEGDQAFIDSTDILDRNNASYDCYEKFPNGNMVEISETMPLAELGWSNFK